MDELLREKLAYDAQREDDECSECGWPLNEPEHHCEECDECMDYCMCEEEDDE